ncbi:MAG: four helix bundle protein [Candidatus Marinimicrobia bacterium]|jgi:four helix bundle protein|nr:four helix bundle protein [Candidatus Neomarinimicrobiota bacterium]
MKAFELEERLITFTVLIVQVTDKLPNSKASMNLAGQLVRSGTSVSLNYGEAQGGESRKDFIHKLKIVLKELRETHIGLKLIKRLDYLPDLLMLEKALKECNELISIFTKSIKTASSKL